MPDEPDKVDGLMDLADHTALHMAAVRHLRHIDYNTWAIAIALCGIGISLSGIGLHLHKLKVNA